MQHIFLPVLPTDDVDCWYVDDVDKNVEGITDAVTALRDHDKNDFVIKTGRRSPTTKATARAGSCWVLVKVRKMSTGVKASAVGRERLHFVSVKVDTTRCNSTVSLNAARDDFVCSQSGWDCDSGCWADSHCVDGKCILYCSNLPSKAYRLIVK